MLALTRKKGEAIIVGDNIEIFVVDVYEDKVKLGIRAPRDIQIMRKELLDEVKHENESSTLNHTINIKNLTELIKKDK